MADTEDYLASNPMAPPCLKIPICGRVCEHSAPCRAVGRCGTQWGAKNRSKLFMLATAVAFVAMLFTAVSVAGVTHDANVLRNVYWAKGTGTMLSAVDGTEVEQKFTTYIGLNMQVMEVEVDGITVFTAETAWSDVSCAGEQCEDCKGAAIAMVSGSILSLISMVPTILTDIQRSQSKWDINCQKSLAQFMSSGAGLVGSLLSLSAFSAGCYRNLPSSMTTCNDESGVCGTFTDAQWNLGPGFILILIATLLKVVDGAIHALVPTPPHCSDPDRYGTELPVQERMLSSLRADARHEARAVC